MGSVLPPSYKISPSTFNKHLSQLACMTHRYVPVKDKRLLFESLGRAASHPRFVLSSDNLPSLGDLTPDPPQPRAQSLHDLTGNNVAVKEICRSVLGVGYIFLFGS